MQPQQHEPLAVQPPSPEQVVDAQLQAYNAHDLERFVQYFTEDVRIENFPGEPLTGTEALRQIYRALFQAFPDIKTSVVRRVCSGNLVVDEEEVTGTHQALFAGIAPTGRSIRLRSATLYEVTGGRISRLTVYSDQTVLLRQLGARLSVHVDGAAGAAPSHILGHGPAQRGGLRPRVHGPVIRMPLRQQEADPPGGGTPR